MGCCGGNAPALEHAIYAMQMLTDTPFDNAAPAPQENAPIRLEYIGDEWGEQVWFSRIGSGNTRLGAIRWCATSTLTRAIGSICSALTSSPAWRLPQPEPELVSEVGELEPRMDSRRGRRR
jgi:hypothetical protein